MKILIASLLLLVGTCSKQRHSEKIKEVKASIVFKKIPTVQTYLNTITEVDLEKHLTEIASDKYAGRMSGEPGHNAICDYIKSQYKALQIKAPKNYPGYFQTVPKSFLPEDTNTSQNVIAYVEGSEFPDEYVVISAHSDHIGIVDGKVYNGADDNGSGTSAILEIAEAFKLAEQNGIRPRRSIVFLHVTAEELGLYGSQYYIQNPVFPLENTVANLNTDMIGRIDKRHEGNDNYVYLIGSDRISTELDFIVREANDEFVNLDLDYKYNDINDTNRYYNRSDHYNFALQDIPVIFFFNGEHKDYHKSSDTIDKISFSALKKRTQLIFVTTWYIANSNNAPLREVL
ncbi:MAG: M28 family peptidase [Winogradskyella sp.]|uniref:M28 family metallopeptidase n=1 Tax=Winogradskyella sp. TaxID=1883156 RepID=UPI00182B6C30|nr:M28 family metallopeptidase [Winogradskyella sp.]MBT8243874.1 M28 family peptidase [Winogradskyella sp.]NNK22279.1 M28 family peptidase [Winogradskyella sp.]